jgi:hypothetical protein
MWHMHAPTFNKVAEEEEEEEDTPHADTWCNAKGVGWLLWWFALMTKFVIQDREM